MNKILKFKIKMSKTQTWYYNNLPECYKFDYLISFIHPNSDLILHKIHDKRYYLKTKWRQDILFINKFKRLDKRNAKHNEYAEAFKNWKR